MTASPAAPELRSVRVRLYAAASERAGSETVEVVIPVGATIGGVRTALAEAIPSLRVLAPHLLFAVGTQYASTDSPLPADGEIVAFPPVSGG